MSVTPPPPPGFASAMPGQATGRFAGFWIRVLAYLIDDVLVGGILFGVIKASGAVTVTCPADTVELTVTCSGGVTSYSPIFYVAIAVSVLYLPVLWGLGGTLGQRILGLRVAGVTSGQAIGIPRGFLRLVGYIVASAVICIGLIWVAFDSRKQGWHDKIAGTVVLRRG